MGNALINQNRTGNYPLEARLDGSMADVYFKPKSFERDGKVYEKLGVRQFKKLPMWMVGGLHRLLGANKTGSNYYISHDKSIRGLKKFETWTRFNELIHNLSNLPFGFGLIGYLGKGDYNGAALCGSGLLINAYCSMLQRYNRARIYNIIEQKKEN